MTTVAEIVHWLEGFAPMVLAEPWDNVGLLWGDPSSQAERVMTCLTVTPTTAKEAITERADLIVSHHPILFREVKTIRADLPSTSFLWQLARGGIAIASPHTAFDNTSGGINDGLCLRLGLLDVSPLRPMPAPASFKVVVFTPESDREAVLSGAFEAGAGRIGAYAECSFATLGQGTFFGSESTNPAVGEKGRRETVDELRLELVCPGSRLASVLSAIRARHSYEEPAIDVYPLHSLPSTSGSGRIGQLREPKPLEEFARFVSAALGQVSVQFAGDPRKLIQRVAVSCGAGDDFLADAAHQGADVLLTGEARFHRVLEAESRDIGIVLVGHYGTERPGVEELAQRIAQAFPGLTVWPSQHERDPLNLVLPKT
ncbi:MAG: Nif3-like dinuclear metal center hexameric protein [Planctomycetaceae bacterium]|nr:Nif3-like dinuclear metal center hexameric protein [Planctomycetaceae bacterium]